MKDYDQIAELYETIDMLDQQWKDLDGYYVKLKDSVKEFLGVLKDEINEGIRSKDELIEIINEFEKLI